MTGSTIIELGSTVTLNSVDAFGTKWRIAANGFDGWGSADSDIDPVKKPRQHGAWAGDSFDTERILLINGTITALTPEILNDAIDTLLATVTNEPFLMQVTESGRTRWQYVRKQMGVRTPKINQLQAAYFIQIVALDPRKFSTPLVQSTALPSTSGGLTVPYTVPYAISAVTVSGQVNLVNPGNETGPVVLRIDGPSHGPSIVHRGSGLAMTFSSSLVLGLGEWLTIDMEKRTVMANDQASRSSYVTSRGWSGFEPGDNTWAFTASSFDAGALLTVTATPAHK